MAEEPSIVITESRIAGALFIAMTLASGAFAIATAAGHEASSPPFSLVSPSVTAVVMGIICVALLSQLPTTIRWLLRPARLVELCRCHVDVGDVRYSGPDLSATVV